MPITIGPERLTDIVTAMMQGAKSAPEEARAIAENLVTANLMGHDSHGVGLAPRYMKHALAGTMKPGARPSVVTDNGAYLLLDGNMGYGQTVCREAMEMAIDRAKKTGVCIMGLRKTHHMGRIGAWGEMAAKAGLISIHYVNTTGHRALRVALGRLRGEVLDQPVLHRDPGDRRPSDDRARHGHLPGRPRARCASPTTPARRPRRTRWSGRTVGRPTIPR